MGKRGHPPIYKSADEMQIKIDEYFESRKGEPLTNADGELQFSKFGEMIYVRPSRPPTITGLALYLGFAGRQALINYQNRSQDFKDTILRAKSRVEEYAEERLYDRDGQRGAEFNLRVNFGWRIETEDDEKTEPTRIIDDV